MIKKRPLESRDVEYSGNGLVCSYKGLISEKERLSEDDSLSFEWISTIEHSRQTDITRISAVTETFPIRPIPPSSIARCDADFSTVPP